ncbi:assimilatory nitrate reductase electron transfer subunit [Mumia flava]|uniref:Assimilatory nitrate reductase electron transfer subunit n=1 Tax=Mumia flava TaxID=1348852 RepID=A0A2M9BE69_9ACTN|nr:FAD-dependent oxidoreductase [Mumia flava]PJJ56243.1 assimilatory nitrate reductase electron transfer subunit [Mumia flava]
MTRQRVVVVGAGMVGVRFAEELIKDDRDGRFEVVVLGEEEYEPYNRILLTELVAGRADLSGLSLLCPSGITLRRGAPVSAIDRDARTVTAGGETWPYDHLVLATGARARVPRVPGLDGPAVEGLPGGVFVLRSVDDARGITAAALNARRAVVIGGGPLGVEAACGMRLRGVDVDVVSFAGHLLDRDLDPEPGRLLADAVADLGIGFHGEAALASVGVDEHGHVDAVVLDDGRTLAADLLVLACGAVPETALAAAAGLETAHGIVVGDDLATTRDPRVHAIGDCAQTPSGTAGLVAPGWDQARSLARRLVDGVASEAVPVQLDGAAMRLKAAGVSLVAMGRKASNAGDARVLTLNDASARRYVEVVVEGDELVGMTCLGSADLAASLSVQFGRRGVLPLDPLALLAPTAGAAPASAGSPTTMPGSTTVCRCNGVTKRDLVHAWDCGATSLDALAADTRATTGCGGCRSLVCGIVDWLQASDPDDPGTEPTSHATSDAREPVVKGA